MAKKWSIEKTYPESKMAIYDEVASDFKRTDLQPLYSRVNCGVLHFTLSTKVSAAKIIAKYGVLCSNILVPLINPKIQALIAEKTNAEDVQFIPTRITIGNEIISDYVLLNPIKMVEAVDQEQSIPTIFKTPGFPDERIGYKKMVLINDFPLWGIGRQHDLSSKIIVGDDLAAAILKLTKKGVEFRS